MERDTFLSRALQWSCTGLVEYKTGHPNLHKRIAEIFWRRAYLHEVDLSSTSGNVNYLHSINFQSEIML